MKIKTLRKNEIWQKLREKLRYCITIHMPQRTSKILLVRLTANTPFLLHRASQSAMNTMHYLTRIRFALVLRKIHFTLDDKVHFCGICNVMCFTQPIPGSSL